MKTDPQTGNARKAFLMARISGLEKNKRHEGQSHRLRSGGKADPTDRDF
ncbi:MAG: hypothetical protein ACREBC_07825 [Pyrinomonadaceae bacterium]